MPRPCRAGARLRVRSPRGHRLQGPGGGRGRRSAPAAAPGAAPHPAGRRARRAARRRPAARRRRRQHLPVRGPRAAGKERTLSHLMKYSKI